MSISSINFQKGKAHSLKHNFRKDLPKYLLKEQDRKENSYWQSERTPKEIFDDEMKILNETKARGKRAKFENSYWEAVLNLNASHGLDEVKKVAEHIEKKFNITCCAIAIHKDEGHYPLKKDGSTSEKPIHNYHAHLNFVTVKDGKQNWRKELIKPKDLRELQTEVAELLQMQRGKDKRETNAERLEHRQYKQEAQKQEKLLQELQGVKNELEAEKVSKAEIKSEFEKLRQESKGKGYEKEFYQALSSEKKKALENIKTKQELERVLQDFKDKHTTKSFFKQKTDYEAIAQKQSEIILEQAEQLETYKEAYQKLETKSKTKIQELEAENRTLRKENRTLKAYIEKIKGTLKNVWSKCRALMSEKFPQRKEERERQEREALANMRFEDIIIQSNKEQYKPKEQSKPKRQRH